MRCLITASILLFSGLSLANDPADGMFGTPQIKSLNTEQARELSELQTTVLDLSGLKSIDQSAAHELAYWPNRPPSPKPAKIYMHLRPLKLPSLKLPKGRANIPVVVLGITSIDKSVAHELASFSVKDLELNGLTTLDKDSATELAKFSGKLILNGVKSLDKDSAQALSKFQGTAVELRGIESLDDDTHSILVADRRIITRR